MRMVCECWKASASFLSLCNSCSINSALYSSKQLWLGLAPHLSHCCLLIIFLISLLAGTGDSMENNHTFLYFAYGSNLLKERLQLKNPSATVHCVAMLKVRSVIRCTNILSHIICAHVLCNCFFCLFQDYKLVFGNHKGLASVRWHGGVATIEHSPGDEVWGVVWRMNMSDLESLDR